MREIPRAQMAGKSWEADIDDGPATGIAGRMPRGLIAIGGLILLGGCSDVCSNTTIAALDAPDGLHTAIMFQRDCGATTGFSTQVSVLDAGEATSDGGNAFRADDNHGGAAVGDWGGPWAEIRWLNSDHLLVRYAANSRIFEQEEEVAGVRISYAATKR